MWDTVHALTAILIIFGALVGLVLIDVCKQEVARLKQENVNLNIELARMGNKNSELRARINPFDHDGDGRPGGSVKRAGPGSPIGRHK